MLGVILLLQALSVAIGGPPTSPEYLPLRLAESGAHFAREGLDVTLRVSRSEAGAAEALLRRQADLAATSVAELLRFGHRPGTALPKLVFALAAAPPVALLVASAHADRVRDVTDLAGGRVAIATPGGAERIWLQAILRRARLRANAVEIVALGTRGVVQALGSGEVRAAMVGEPDASRLLRDARAVALADLRSPEAARQAVGHPSVNAAVFTAGDRPVDDAALVAFARALLAAERELATASPADLAGRLPRDVVGLAEEFAHRAEAFRSLRLVQGLVGAHAVGATFEMIRTELPLPRSITLRRPEEMLHLGPLRQALDTTRAR